MTGYYDYSLHPRDRSFDPGDATLIRPDCSVSYVIVREDDLEVEDRVKLQLLAERTLCNALVPFRSLSCYAGTAHQPRGWSMEVDGRAPFTEHFMGSLRLFSGVAVVEIEKPPSSRKHFDRWKTALTAPLPLGTGATGESRVNTAFLPSLHDDGFVGVYSGKVTHEFKNSPIRHFVLVYAGLGHELLRAAHAVAGTCAREKMRIRQAIETLKPFRDVSAEQRARIAALTIWALDLKPLTPSVDVAQQFDSDRIDRNVYGPRLQRATTRDATVDDFSVYEDERVVVRSGCSSTLCPNNGFIPCIQTPLLPTLFSFNAVPNSNAETYDSFPLYTTDQTADIDSIDNLGVVPPKGSHVPLQAEPDLVVGATSHTSRSHGHHGRETDAGKPDAV